MKNIFFKILKKYEFQNSDIYKQWNLIEKHYNEKRRKYHNLNHIKFMINHLNNYNLEQKDYNIIAIAIFYHDIIYDINANDNEEKSCIFFKNNINYLFPYKNEVVDLIMITKTHQPNNINEKIISDLDLLVFALDYNNYKQNIREEYEHISDTYYNLGRKYILSKFMNRQIYYCENNFKYENIAKENIAKELDKY